MSERTMMLGMAFVAALWAQVAQGETEDCTPLPAGFVMCADGTPWAEATMLAFENGIAFELDPYWLEMFEAPASLELGETEESTAHAIAGMIAEQARNEGLGVPETLAQGSFETEHARFVTLTTRVDLPDDAPMVYMTMVADSGGAHLILTFDADLATSMEGVSETFRQVADMIRPASGD